MCASIALEQLQLDIDDVALRLVRLAAERGVTLCCAESLQLVWFLQASLPSLVPLLCFWAAR